MKPLTNSSNLGLRGLERKLIKIFLNITKNFPILISGYCRKSSEILLVRHIKKLSGTKAVPASANLVRHKIETLVLGRAFGLKKIFDFLALNPWASKFQKLSTYFPRAGAFLLPGDFL